MNRIPPAWLLVLALSANGYAQQQSGKMKEVTISRADLCVTEGAIEQLPDRRMSVAVPKMRAYLNLETPQYLEAHFTYLGPTADQSPLGSGELRSQFGLKLRAQDACNLLYVMWRIEPESKLVVSVKSNPGQYSSSECSDHGYKNIKPAHSTSVPSLAPGQTHTLSAEMNGAELTVFVDNSPAWEGNVGLEAMSSHGPMGIRSDNARLDLELRTKVRESHGGQNPTCRAGPEVSD